MSDRVLVAGAPGALALPLARRLRRAVRSHALLLDEIDLRAGQGGRETDAELIESWTRSSRTLSTACEWIADDPPGTLVLFPWWPAGGLRARSSRRQLLEEGSKLVESALEAGVERLVVWSTAAVYQAAEGLPSREHDALVETGRWAEAARFEGRLDRLATTASAALYRFRSVPVLGDGAAHWLAPLRDARVLPRGSRRTPFQFIDLEDAVEILVRALQGGHPGLYNVAADGLIGWSELCRAMDCGGVPLPGAGAGVALAKGGDVDPAGPSLVEQLAAARVLDPTRLKTHFGYRPGRNSRQALRAARGASAGVTAR